MASASVPQRPDGLDMAEDLWNLLVAADATRYAPLFVDNDIHTLEHVLELEEEDLDELLKPLKLGSRSRVRRELKAAQAAQPSPPARGAESGEAGEAPPPPPVGGEATAMPAFVPSVGAVPGSATQLASSPASAGGERFFCPHCNAVLALPGQGEEMEEKEEREAAAAAQLQASQAQAGAQAGAEEAEQQARAAAEAAAAQEAAAAADAMREARGTFEGAEIELDDDVAECREALQGPLTQFCPTLTRISLMSMPEMGAEIVACVVAAATEMRLPALLELDLDGNSIDDAGATAVAGALRHLPNLQRLDLHGNLISDAGATAVAEALRHLPNLEEVGLIYNDVSRDVGTRLEEEIKQRLPSCDVYI